MAEDSFSLGSGIRGGPRLVIAPPAMLFFAVLFAAALGGPPVQCVAIASPPCAETHMEAARRLLRETPLVDGHNNFPTRLRRLAHQQLQAIDLRQNLKDAQNDIPRMREGMSAAHMFAAKVTCHSQSHDAVRRGLTQVDLIRRMVRMYPDFALVTEADGIMEAFQQRKIGSIITLESGHVIDSSLAVLRMFYDLGVRGMTLTYLCSTPWADCHYETLSPHPTHNGLTEFGKLLVMEMNRLGMIVDLSHVSDKTMRDALDVSEAPVHFSHSGAFGVCNCTRNVKDDVLLKLKENGGILMIPFIDHFIGCRYNSDSDKVQLSEVADHFDYVRKLIGVDYLGIGTGFDCCRRDPFAEGLEDVSTYPNLFAELLRRGWTEAELKKVAGLNIIRVWKQVEAVRDRLAAKGKMEIEELIPREFVANEKCRTGID